MPVKAYAKGGSRTLKVSLPTSPLRLDVTSERSTLRDGEASVIIGRDVLSPGRLAKAPGRRPLAPIMPEGMPADLDLSRGGHPLTCAIPCEMSGNYGNRKTISSGKFVEVISGGDRIWKFVTVSQSAGGGTLCLTEEGVERFGFWPDEAFGAEELFRDSAFIEFDSIPYATLKRVVPGDGSAAGEIKCLEFNPADFPGHVTTAGGTVWGLFVPGVHGNNSFEVTLKWTEFHDKRGIWVSNGQKFWLLQGGKFTEYMDLGHEAIGAVWRGAQISPTTFMFVSPNQIPRAIHLNSLPRSGTANDVDATRYLAGMLAPARERTQERASVVMRNPPPGIRGDDDVLNLVRDEALSSSSGFISAGGKFRVAIRVVDHLTGAASGFVGANANFSRRYFLYPAEFSDLVSGDDVYLIVIANVFSVDDLENLFPFKTARATHVEFWRTTSSGVYYYRELVLPLAWPKDTFHTIVEVEDYNTDPYYVADGTFSTLVGTQGWLASETSFRNNFGLTLLERGRHAVLAMTDEELVGGVLGSSQAPMLMNNSIERSGGLPPMCRDVTSILGCTITGGANRRQYNVKIQQKLIRWARIQHDEQIRYSEISGGDTFLQPESFHNKDFRTLGRQGDKFQRFVGSGDIVLAVMHNGVYRIERLATRLSVRRLGQQGVGTPWPEAVLSIGKVAAWVTPGGIRTYDAEANDGRGELNFVPQEGITEWLAEAVRHGWEVEAGYDGRRGTLHLRRSFVTRSQEEGSIANVKGVDGDNLFMRVGYDPENMPASDTLTLVPTVAEGVAATSATGFIRYYFMGAAVVNLKTGDWSLIDDDTGFRYVQSTYADVSPLDVPALYSITQNGEVFEENYEGDSHPYDGFTVQGTLNGSTAAGADRITAEDGQITLKGNYPETSSYPDFSPAMLGDVLRYKKPKNSANNYPRRITSVTARVIRFDAMGVLPDTGDEFTIGASRMRVRWAPIYGGTPESIKTLESLSIRARPGRRHLVNPKWPTTPIGKITAKVYRDYGDIAVSEDSQIAIYGDNDEQQTTSTRHSAITGQGNALEIEIESLDARTDFVIDSVAALVREDGDEVEDTSVTM